MVDLKLLVKMFLLMEFHLRGTNLLEAILKVFFATILRH